jgi:hypothetical protein
LEILEENPPKRDNVKKQRESLVWNEGFATYCSEVAFRQIYPRGISYNPSYEGIYLKGLNLVRDLVAKQGPEVLMKIPTNWKSLQESLDNKQRKT